MTALSADQQMTDDEFYSLLSELNTHHKQSLAAITSGETRPGRPESASGLTDDDYSKLPVDAKKAFADTLQGELGLLADSKKDISSLLRQAHEGKITADDLASGVEDRETKNKEGLSALNDALTASLKESGKAHPESRNLILSAFKAASDTSTDVWDRAKTLDDTSVSDVEHFWDKAGPSYDALAEDLSNRWKIFA
ncbi:hypothetical protein ACIODT_13170 [Streptomyces sp. NPDC088251]|uniref:hypothetical protein n=1 Tax=unclassified Streptomyces TaxID=2593676 RepID=UPI00340F7ECD